MSTRPSHRRGVRGVRARASMLVVALASLTGWGWWPGGGGSCTRGARVAWGQVTDAPAPQLFPDPSKFSYGMYTAGEVGAVTALGPLHAHLGPGWGLGVVVGYDVTRWLAVEARGLGSTHTTHFPDGPQDGELLQLYQGLGALRLSLRRRSLALSVSADGGVLHTSTNVLATAGLNDQRTSLVYGGGLGVDYHTLSRHFAVGLRGSYVQARGLDHAQLLVTTAFLRYAF
jgi:hypothetical protein